MAEFLVFFGTKSLENLAKVTDKLVTKWDLWFGKKKFFEDYSKVSKKMFSQFSLIWTSYFPHSDNLESIILKRGFVYSLFRQISLKIDEDMAKKVLRSHFSFFDRSSAADR